MLDSRRRQGHGGLLGIACAVGIASTELVFVAKRRIRPVYLADAAVEAAIAAASLRAFPRFRAGPATRIE